MSIFGDAEITSSFSNFYYERNVLGIMVIGLTCYCLYLQRKLYKQKSSENVSLPKKAEYSFISKRTQVNDKTPMLYLSKPHRTQPHDMINDHDELLSGEDPTFLVDEDYDFDGDVDVDVDDIMTKVREKTIKPHDTASSSQQKLSSTVPLDALTGRVKSFAESMKTMAIENQKTPEGKQLLANVFQMFEMGENSIMESLSNLDELKEAIGLSPSTKEIVHKNIGNDKTTNDNTAEITSDKTTEITKETSDHTTDITSDTTTDITKEIEGTTEN